MILYNINTLILSSAACPVLCSANGQYTRGRCQCYSGWKGTECDVPASQCIDPQCGGHGLCVAGNCVCNAGHKGPNCEQGKWSLKTICICIFFSSDRKQRDKTSFFPREAPGGSTQSIGQTSGCFRLHRADNARDVVIDTERTN